MKLVLASIPFALAAPQQPPIDSANESGLCLSKVASAHPDRPCNDPRSLYEIRNLIGVINCPNGEASADQNPACAGGYAWWDTNQSNGWLSYDALVANALRNYGCNCFPRNKWVENLFGKEWKHVMTGLNGEPLDEIDAACAVMAKRVNCLDIDFNSLELKDWPGSNDNNPRDTCDYIQWYATFDNGNGVTCGDESNPNYIDDSNWWYKPENIGYHNMNQCRNTLCEIEMEFARSVAPLLRDPNAFATANSGNKGAWDKGACQMTKHYMNMDSCCGDKFNRVPFDSSLQQCCDGVVTEFGGC